MSGVRWDRRQICRKSFHTGCLACTTKCTALCVGNAQSVHELTFSEKIKYTGFMTTGLRQVHEHAAGSKMAQAVEKNWEV